MKKLGRRDANVLGFVILYQLSRDARYDRRKKHIYKQDHPRDID